ncbi:MAG TPA: transaldolase [Cyclobacteriaceae bacterium]|jgi:transaldolase|nr:transaldolase [Cyclobacteriaceae bacterium]
MNTLIDLLNYGQSYWLDNLTRKKIISGELNKRVSEQGLRGITSNPSIFTKAITQSTDYDEQIFSMVKNGKSAKKMYDAITIKDVQDACDILKPVYDQSDGIDGFVSLEVSPYLAHDTKGTIKKARKLFQAVGRPNCFIKIPGTREGIPAIEQMLYEGVNINITLLFSVERYIEVEQAYIRAIERRAVEGLPVNNVISVASIFISRIDVLMDMMLKRGSLVTDHTQSLLGKAGVATARLCYQHFKKTFTSKNWKRLEEKGAHVQRLLWASTSNKDAHYDDLRYIEPLIGKNTINTLPDETITALADHGKLKMDSIEEDVDQAKQLFISLEEKGIDISGTAQDLENEGVRKFTDAYNDLIDNLENKRKAVNERISTISGKEAISL